MSRQQNTIPSLPAILRPIAAAWIGSEPSSIAARNAEIMDTGRSQLRSAGLLRDDARRMCEQAADWGRSQRRTRLARRVATRLGYTVEANPVVSYLRREGRTTTTVGCIPHGTPSNPKNRATLPYGSTTDRLHGLIRAALYDALHENYRMPNDDHGSETILITHDPAEIGVTQGKDTNWNLYRGSFKGWAAGITNTAITIPHKYLTRVIQRGLVVVDGLVTLDASPMDATPRGVELYSAVWLAQGRGYTLRAQRGYIARQNGTAYHGGTAKKALAGLKRKVGAQEWQAELRTAHFEGTLARFQDRQDNLRVCLSDARAVGACEYGIRSWCNTVGLDYDAGCATLRQVADAYRVQPQPEARAAILHSLRRVRSGVTA